MPLIIKQEAADDIAHAYDWYEAQQQGLGESFLAALSDCFDFLRANPRVFAFIYQEQRQMIVRKFPYLIVYEIEAETVVVFAVFHASKNPPAKFRK